MFVVRFAFVVVVASFVFDVLVCCCTCCVCCDLLCLVVSGVFVMFVAFVMCCMLVVCCLLRVVCSLGVCVDARLALFFACCLLDV